MTQEPRTCILVTENDVLVRNLVSTVLSNEGYYVLAAANDAEALELSHTFAGPIQLLLAKKMTLANAIAEKRPEIRVVLLSAPTSAELKEIVRTIDPGAFRQRAILPKKMSDSIHRMLSRREGRGRFEEV